MEKLTGFQRLIYEAVVIEGRPRKTVAARYGLGPHSIRSHIYRARVKGMTIPDGRSRFSLPRKP